MLRSPLLHFLLIGGLLFLVTNAASRVPETPVVIVPQSEIDERLDAYRQQMGRATSEREARAIEDQVIDNALWLEQAFALGLHEIDSVVRQRLILNMRFLESQTAGADGQEASESSFTDDALVARAIELGMDKSDTVVRRRLVDRVQAIVRAGVRAKGVDEATLEAHYQATQDRWREPPIVDLVHVYLSRDRRGPRALEDARALLSKLSQAETSVDDALALGDPFLAGHRLRGATPNRVTARLGPQFTAAIEGQAPGAWFGPVESAFGQHVVWIEGRVESHVPPLEEIRERVVEDWLEEASRKALRDHITKRRTQVELRITQDRG